MAGQPPRVLRKVKVDGKWKLLTVPMKGGRVDFAHLEVGGKTIATLPGSFYLDYGHGKSRKRACVGSDPASVRRAMQTQTHVLELRKSGIDVDDAPEIKAGRIEGVTLAAVLEEFTAAPPVKLAKRTADKYRSAIAVFVAWAADQKLTHASQVDRKVIDRWIAHMRDREGLVNSTIMHKALAVVSELRKHDAPLADIKVADLPRVVQRERDIYKAEDLDELFAVCSFEEELLFQTFLQSGFREQELAHLEWSDVDFERSTLAVTEKPEHGFRPKNYQERVVRIPLWLTELLAKLRKRKGATHGIVFGTSEFNVGLGSAEVTKDRRGRGGRPDKNMLLKLKRLALKAGLNCKRCQSTWHNKPVTCATHPVCGKWGLHKFRHTYATALLRDKVDMVSLQKLMGHKDIASTRKYLRALDPEQIGPQIEESSMATRYRRA